MNKIQRPVIALSIVVSALVLGAWPMAALAATQPRMGTAANFAVLAGSTITNTGPTVISGGLGLFPGTAVTGNPVASSKHVTDAVALSAKNALVTAYNDLASWGPTRSLTGQDLGGKTLTPGVYRFSSSAQLTGTLTLSGNGIFIFQMGSTLTTASNSKVLVRNGAQGCGVYWKVGSSATLGTGTQFQGTVIALTSITMVTGATILPGRALARNGAVTLDSNRISKPAAFCSATGTTSSTKTNTGTTSTLAQTGGGPLQGSFPWVLVLIAGVASSLGGLGFVMSNRSHRLSRR
ncbi:MAG TPA: ice-binding family protein [Candidatus Dormibacteraeota bacterium]|nr:ice-binding family protein [Candidatus Dormibacteraeota bacterium]